MSTYTSIISNSNPFIHECQSMKASSIIFIASTNNKSCNVKVSNFASSIDFLNRHFERVAGAVDYI